MNSPMLGKLSARTFLRRYWQKGPLFVPQALPGFNGVIDSRALAALARRDDVESRIVEKRAGQWRTPRGGELGAAFLDWLHERGLPDAVYRDPQLAPVVHPAQIPSGMLAFTEKLLSRVRWSRRDVTDFLGRYLSAPKPHVVFRRSAARGRGVRLDARSQLLYRGERFFLNGESFSVPAGAVS